MSTDEAYDVCLRVARSHYENFPVASRLLPARMRPHVAAIYAFARAADDFADEGTRTSEERLALLEAWRHRLHAAVGGGRPAREGVQPGEPDHTGATFVALGHSIRALDLPVELFDHLLDAFEQDVRVTRYERWSDLLDYCRKSANPVGRLVLRVAGRVDGQLDAWSDALCTALQLTNFWQDFAPDATRGRIYLPRETQRAHGAREEGLGQGGETPWRHALAECVARTRPLFEESRPLPAALSGRLRWEIRATWLGGHRMLDTIERRAFDSVTSRPTLGLADGAWIVMNLLR